MGRNKHHLQHTEIKKLQNNYADYTIEEATIHRSKGLEADYIIILGLEEGLKGFPRKMDDDPLIKNFSTPGRSISRCGRAPSYVCCYEQS